MIILHPPQLSLVEKSRNTGKRSVLIQAPTGFGKSIIAAYIIQSAMAKNTRTMFTVPRLELLSQMSKNYCDFNIPHTFVAAGEKYHPQVNNVIASLPSLKSRMGKITPPQLLICDESHYGDKALDSVISWAKNNGAFILGLSATPMKNNGKGLGCWYDAMVEGPTIKWLIDNNYLSKYRAFAPSTTDNSMLRMRDGDYTAETKEEWVKANKQIVGSAVESYKKFAMGKRGVTFTVSRAESIKVCAAYNAAGIPAAVIDGETPKEERKQLAIALATGEILQLVCCRLLVFGYDLSAASGMNVVIQCLTDLCPSGSLADLLQKWGRVLRFEFIGADPHIILDHVGNIGGQLGFPDDDRHWTLADREKRTSKKKSDEKDIQARICPKCFYVHKPMPVCPDCGHIYQIQSREIEEVDGELQEIQREVKKKQDRQRQGMAQTMDDLMDIAEEKKHSKFWVKKMCSIKNIPFDDVKFKLWLQGVRHENN